MTRLRLLNYSKPAPGLNDSYSLSGMETKMSKAQEKSKGADYKLERYKYILQQLHSLNENHHKYLTLFQTLSAAVMGAGVGLFVGWRELKVDATTVRLSLRGLFGLFVILVLLLFVNLLVSVFAWIDYRKEEVE